METEPCYRAQLEKAIRECRELDEAIRECREQQRNMSLSDNSAPEFTDDELRFRDITEKMRETFLKKNHDYGNSFHETWDEFGDKGII